MVCNATLSEPPGNLGGCRQPRELCSWGSAGPEKARGQLEQGIQRVWCRLVSALCFTGGYRERQPSEL